MSSARWRQVESLFGRALEMPGSERELFLEQAAGDDSSLLEEVRELLTCYEEDREFLEREARAAELTGEKIGDYFIEGILGEGGMSVVYRGRHVESGDEVAIKALRVEALANPGVRKRFDREYRALALLDHRNVVRVHGLERDAGGRHFLVMELVEGVPLSALLTNGSGFPLEVALDYAHQIALALAAAHAAGLVHRDVKPENVIVTPNRVIRVLDFGLCKWTHEDAVRPGLSRTYAGVLLGTAPYMSPEQAQGLPIDQRSDLFSFGALFYEMLSGRRAFEATNPVATLAALLHEEPANLTGIPLEVDQIVRTCLRKNPAQRYFSAEEVAEKLEIVIGRHRDGKLRRRSFKWRRAWRWAIGAAAAVASVVAVWRVAQPVEVTPPDFRVVSLTSVAGKSAMHPSFSPDGKFVVYTLHDGAAVDLYIQQIGESAVRRLTYDPGHEGFASWSPEGSRIAFIRRRGNEATYHVVPAWGGVERLVAKAQPELVRSLSPPVSWFPDGRRLAIIDRASPGKPLAIFSLSLETGERRELTDPPAGWVGDGCPRVSPDGSLLAFRRSEAPGAGDIYVTGSNGGEPRRLTTDRKGIAGLAWTAGGRSLAFASNRSGTMYSLWKVGIFGGAPERLPVGEEAYYPAISHAGNRLAYTRTILSSSVHRVALSGAARGTPLISSSRFELAGQYSPDGRQITFLSNRTGAVQVWIADSEGRNERQVTFVNATFMTSPRWSPDNRDIAFSACVNGDCDVYAVSAEGGAPRRITADSFKDETPCWSEDSLWIYFASHRDGAWRIWKAPANGGPAILVTRASGYAPQISGGYLYFVRGPDEAGLWRVPVAGGEATSVLPSLAPGMWRYYSVAGGSVYFVGYDTKSQPSVLKRMDVTSGRVSTIAVLEKPAPMTHAGIAYYEGLGISRDGKWALYTQSGQNTADIFLVENFW